MVVEDNKCFCRLRFTGKHVGDLLGVAPTYRTVAWMGATEFTCQNGKILKVWELGDLRSLEEQLKQGVLLE
jgi:predicted ester cyclase